VDTIKINGVEYVDTNQAAAILGLSARTLINARSEGRPPRRRPRRQAGDRRKRRVRESGAARGRATTAT